MIIELRCNSSSDFPKQLRRLSCSKSYHTAISSIRAFSLALPPVEGGCKVPGRLLFNVPKACRRVARCPGTSTSKNNRLQEFPDL